MSALRIDLSTVPNHGLGIKVKISEQELRPSEAAPMALGEITVSGRLDPIDQEYLFRGTVSGTYEGHCARCLKPVALPYAYEVMWTFEEGAAPDKLGEGAEDEDDLPGMGWYAGDVLDLAPLAWEEIVLDAPVKYLCDESCPGLCPGCGADLNAGPCGCREEQTDNKRNTPFSGLAELFPELGPQNGKD